VIEYAAAIVLAFISAWLVRVAGVGSLDRLVEAISQLVSGWKSEPWPRGVQEEDRDAPWGARRVDRRSEGDRAQDAEPAPSMSRVRGTVRAR
jgi:hypothetical protein